MVVTTLKARCTYGVYDVIFHDSHIETTVTSCACIVGSWISDSLRIHAANLHNLLIGLDTEWHIDIDLKGRQPLPIATLQLCIDQRCLIFQIRRADIIPKSLFRFLRNKNFTFVGVGVKTDVDKLWDNFRLVVSHSMDVASKAALVFDDEEMKRKGLKKISLELLGKEMDKPKHVTLSKWGSMDLSAAQIEYACIDAYVSFQLGMFLRRELRTEKYDTRRIGHAVS